MQYAHRSWRTDENALLAHPQSLAQTSGGYLWNSDGIRFTKWSPPAGRSLPGASTWLLFAARDGTQTASTVSPAWYQTLTFHILAGLVLLAIATLSYFYRLRVYANSLRQRLDERLQERTRLARDLHDTLLQTIQGSKMVADDARDHVEDARLTARALDRLSDWLDRASIEGRAALEALRRSSIEANDLVVAIQRVADDCIPEARMDATISTVGTIREMHPITRDEVYRIAYEAIRNSCAHSGSRNLWIELQYKRRFRLEIRDNGRGIDEETLRSGNAGHLGLAGMRERAAYLGGTLNISSSQQAGTTVTLVVPGQVIYTHPMRGLRSWITQLFKPDIDHSEN
ncbi:sensor histidine kinase [Granulicella sp. S190]|uniref:sensor histidine kinase n=1 Tax=Granulicella sp. S190 TaxID=1747226 RepID=UPI00131E6340|nr:ATP-binding protein [Granulicella sp. S190]